MPVAPASTPDLLDLIRKSGIAAPERLAAAVPSDADLPPEPQKAAGVLVQRGVITRFQAQQLLQGRHKGFRLGSHVILEQLGRGGMGIVYLAEHQELRRKVAIKVLVVGKDEDAKLAAERFFREARAAAALDHPNIVRIFDVCRHNDTPYLVMEYVDGETLQQLLDREGPLPYATAADAVAQSAAGLQHAYEKGFVHRDIKPGNLMRDRTGVVKLLDMGLARSAHNSEDKLTERLDAGAVVGTADFIAPEQALNSPGVDIRADIYSLGASFFALVTGKPPFEGNTTQKLLQHQMAAAPSLSKIDATLPKGLAGVVAKMLAKKPNERFQTPAEVIAALAPWLGNSQRVLAGLSRTNLGAGADLHAKLQGQAGSTGRLGRQLTEPDSATVEVDPADAASETGAVASARTARTEPRPAKRAGGAKRPLFPVVAGGVAVAAAAAGIAFALGAFDPAPKGDQTQAPPPLPPITNPGDGPKNDTNPAPKTDPPKKKDTTPPKVAPAPKVPEKMLAGFDLSGRKAFAIRSTVELQASGAKQPKQLSRTGTGEPPDGWSARCWNKDSHVEFFADDASGVGLRNVRGPGSAMLFSPKVAMPAAAARVRIDYSAAVKGGTFQIRFKPDDSRGAWDAARPPLTAPGVWRSYEFVPDLKGATAGVFEIHNSDGNPDAAVRVRSFVVTEPPPGTPFTPVPQAGTSAAQAAPAPAASPYATWAEGAPAYRFDAAAVPAFRVTKEGSARTAGDPEQLPRGVSARCWKKTATGEFRRDDVDGAAALGLTNFTDEKSGQFAFELERDVGAALRPGAVYRVKIGYLARNEASGMISVQTQEFKTVASAKLPGPAGGWKTAAVEFERKADVPVRITVDNHAVGEGNTVYFRTLEVVELTPPAPAGGAAATGGPDGATAFRLDAATVPAFRVTKEHNALTGGVGEQLPKGVYACCWKKTATGEFRRDDADGAPALGLTNLTDEKSAQYGIELEKPDGVGLTLRPGRYRVRVAYLTRADATGFLDVQTLDYQRVASLDLTGTGGAWRTATLEFDRAAGVPVRLTVDNTSVGEGNTLYFRSVELVEVAP